MTKSIDQLRRDARTLKTGYEAGDAHARQRLMAHPPRSDGAELKHADFLHVVARENNFSSWPALKLAVELHGMDKAAKQQRLKIALAHGQTKIVERLLDDMPDLTDGVLGLEIALYRREAVEVALQVDPSCLSCDLGPVPALVHLARSRMIHAWPERQADMLAIANLLLAHGADLNQGVAAHEGSEHKLSPLYFAIGHADNMVLGRWLLEHGANPNDGETLYHATELGHHDGLTMLLEHGADPRGTNALLRAMDFDDVEAVRMLLDAGAIADEFDADPVGGEKPSVVPALHQAARRLSPPAMIKLLLDAGADPSRTYEGCSAYGYARVFGNDALADAIISHSVVVALTSEEELLAKAADGEATDGQFIDTAKLPEAYRDMIRIIAHLPGKLEHVKRLVALGVEFDRPDGEGLTPVQAAGWEGLPDVLAYFLRLSPDLSHVNGYGGTLLSTIIHGSENNPQRAGRDYVACLDLVLKEGVALPRRAIELAGDPEIGGFLTEWAQSKPGQVVEGGVA